MNTGNSFKAVLALNQQHIIKHNLTNFSKLYFQKNSKLETENLTELLYRLLNLKLKI